MSWLRSSKACSHADLDQGFLKLLVRFLHISILHSSDLVEHSTPDGDLQKPMMFIVLNKIIPNAAQATLVV